MMPEPRKSALYDPSCRRCPRLARFLDTVAADHPTYWCKPVPPFGDRAARLDQPPSKFKFAHGARHSLQNGVILFDSYHCSRYNTNTRRLTPQMFRDVFDAIAVHLAESKAPRQ